MSLHLPTPGLLTQTENIPAHLQSIAQWVTWKPVKRADKVAKIPVDWRTKDEVDAGDSQYWTTFENVVAAMRADPRYGIGFALSEGASVIVFDADDPSQFGVMDVITAAAPTYVETSVSGVGRHYVWLGTLPHGRGTFLLGARGVEKRIEVYCADRFIAMTGQRLPHGVQDVNSLVGEVADYLANLPAPEPLPPVAGTVGVLGLSDEDLFSSLSYHRPTTAEALVRPPTYGDKSEMMRNGAGDMLKISADVGQVRRMLIESPLACAMSGVARRLDKYWLPEALAANNRGLPSVGMIAHGRAVVASIDRLGGLHRTLTDSTGLAVVNAIPPAIPPVEHITLKSLLDQIGTLGNDDDAKVMPILEKAATIRLNSGDTERLLRTLEERRIRFMGIGVLRKMYQDARRQHMNEVKAASNDWRMNLLQAQDGSGRPLSCEYNVLQALSCHEAIVELLAWDEFYGDVFVMRCPPWIKDDAPWSQRPFSDEDAIALAAFLQAELSMMAASELVWKCVALVAKQHGFDSMIDRLDSLTWDGQPRLETWLIDYAGAEDTPFNRAVGWKWFVGMVARQYDPGCKMDNILALEGEQGAYKTMLFESVAFGEDFFHEFVGDFDNRDHMMPTRGKLVIELAEGVSHKRADRDKFKAGVSRRSDDFRDPFMRKNVKRERRFVMAYTGNEAQYLNDPTGARRMWPVKVNGVIDIAGIRKVLPQLWAEAVARYRAHVSALNEGRTLAGSVAATGHHWWIDTAADVDLVGEHREVASERQQEYRWKGVIEKWTRYTGSLIEGQFVVTGERPEQLIYIENTAIVYTGAINRDLSRMTEVEKREIADTLRQLGYVSKGVWPRGDRKLVKRMHGYWLNSEAHRFQEFATILYEKNKS
jgi:hypothetical protein